VTLISSKEVALAPGTCHIVVMTIDAIGIVANNVVSIFPIVCFFIFGVLDIGDRKD
jgi:hypothetical protein